MKKTISILILGALPALALASGMYDHEHGRGDHEATSYGVSGEAAQVSRTIEVQAADNMRYTPAAITAQHGETIKFVVKNTGRLPHEFVLGDAKSLKAHAALMRRYPDMEHDDPNMAKVVPGGTATLIWTFTQPGTVEFACLMPGHYEAGMKGGIEVSAK